MLPSHAPEGYKNRAILWNAVEKVEKAKNAQLARKLDIALPIELTREQQISLAREYVKNTFVAKGMCADLCVHDTGNGNPHFHVMLTLRPINEDGTWGSKQKKEYKLDKAGNKNYDPKKRQYKCRSIPSTDWNNQENADKWRAAWEKMVNDYLERLGINTRIDRRSYAEQGIDLIPSIKMGAAASQMERKGIRTERGDINRDIAVTNKEIRILNARISRLEKWLSENYDTAKQPTMYEVICNILYNGKNSTITNLKNASEMLIFLQRNQIYEMSDLQNKINAMHGNLYAIGESLKKIERRIKVLKEHLKQSDNFKKYRKYKRHYDELYAQYETARKETGFGAKRKAEKALAAANDYYESYRTEIVQFENADKYMRGVLQSHYKPGKLPPIKKWRDELMSKTAQLNTLTQEYHTLICKARLEKHSFE